MNQTATKHTPGPWAFKDDGTIRSKAFGNSDQMCDYRGIIVCDLCRATGCDEWPPGRTHAIPEAEANARLIAAAPELLEACRDCVENCTRCENGLVAVLDMDGSHDEPCPCCTPAQQAIAKATQ